ncbi:MAG: response regulator [Hyphomicrobiales bacterium]|nr:response regulator [Hyphomicrobiales bacterium]
MPLFALGKRILIVEDEPLIGMLLEDMVTQYGASVAGPATRVQEALELAQTESLDAAILDMNLHGDMSFPVADALRERGVPFMFLSGYGETADAARAYNVLILPKPIEEDRLERALSELLGGPSAPAEQAS